jgi:hypothetical protein
MGSGKIFVCYRREDSAGHAGRLYDRLNQRFAGRVFMDVAGIGVATRWADVIEQTLRSCEVAVILIGKHWLDRDAGGVRRLDHPEDPLRAEITRALRLKLKVVPLLVGGAAIPDHSDLPSDIASITDWQALRIDDDDFDHDATRLIRALEGHLDEGEAGRHQAAEVAERDQIGRPPDRETRARSQPLSSARGLIGWIDSAARRLVVLFGVLVVAVIISLIVSSNQEKNGGKPSSPENPASGKVQAPSNPNPAGADDQSKKNVVQVIGRDLPESERKPQNTQTPRAPVPTTSVQGSPGSESTASSISGIGRQPQQQPAQPRATLSLAGVYAMVTYTEQGRPLQVVGKMQLTQLSDTNFYFDTFVTEPRTGARVEYHGLLQSQGASWTTTTLQTNDQNAVAGPIPTQLSFDGVTLSTSNAYGQAAVWRKQ